MKCLLINPDYPQKHSLLFPVPPLGMALIAAVMEQNGVDVWIEDQFASGISNQELADNVTRLHPDLLGFSCLTPSINHAIDLARLIRSKGFSGKILMGNIHPSLFAEELLKSEACDFIVRGEGEETVKELLLALRGNSRFEDIQGLSFKTPRGEIVHNPSRDQIQNLTSCPIPPGIYLPLTLSLCAHASSLRFGFTYPNITRMP